MTPPEKAESVTPIPTLSPPEGNMTTFIDGVTCGAWPGRAPPRRTSRTRWSRAGGADCSQLQPGGRCYQPNMLLTHAFNVLYQQNGNQRHRLQLRRRRSPRQAGPNLVYPFFENGSLDSWLFHGGTTQERRRLLPWPARRGIAVDVAKALAYLHHECWQQILHLDVKPGNILLDGDLRAHLSDFGISMSITRDMSSVDTRGRGTPGYIGPEMLVNAVSAKSDVFSYGMTLLELVGGRRNFDPAAAASSDAATAAASSATPDFTRDFFPYIVRDKMARGELMEAVDAAMALVDREEVEAVVKVALCCIQSRWDMRPTMLTVVDMLEGRVAADLPLQSRRLSTVDFSDQLSSSSSLTQGR